MYLSLATCDWRWWDWLAIASAASYIIAQVILCHITVLRLRLVASSGAAKWAGRLLKAALLLGALFVAANGMAPSMGLPEADLVVNAVLGVVVLVYVLFQCHALAAFARAARDALDEARRDASDARVIAAATRALATVAILAASASTTILYAVFSAVYEHAGWVRWAFQISVILDVPFDAGLVLLSAGLVGPDGDRAGELAAVGRLVRERRERQIFETLVEAARIVRERSEVGSALGQR